MTRLRNLNPVVLVLATTGIVACARGSAVSECRVGDLTASLNSESSQFLQGHAPWAKHVRECDVGEYTIDTPAAGGYDEIMVSRNGHALFLSTDGTTVVMDPSGKRVLFEANQSGGTSGLSVSYATHDRVSDTWIENVDFGGDGSVDYRTTETAGGTIKREYSVDQRWLELVERGNRNGVVLDGEFMTPAAARERLAGKRKSQAGQ